MVVCPEDIHRLNWQFDPRNNFDKGAWLPFQAAPGGHTTARWPYSSTYQVVPASYDGAREPNRITQGAHYSYNIPGGSRLGGLRLTAVRYPASKVHIMDSEQRHFGRRNVYYGSDPASARIPQTMFDASVQVIMTADTNLGWQPNQPTNPGHTIFGYTPRPWEAPAISPVGADLARGYYRWTRGGLQGVDIGSGEVGTGQ
jgi:hypothetical protein